MSGYYPPSAIEAARAEGEALLASVEALTTDLDAPDFRPVALAAFEARGFRREHRRTHGPDHFTAAEVAAFEARKPAPLTPAEMARLCREGEAADDAVAALMRERNPMPVKRVLTRKESTR